MNEPSFFQKAAAEKQAKYEREYTTTPERTEVLAQIRALLDEEILPVLVKLAGPVQYELGFTLHENFERQANLICRYTPAGYDFPLTFDVPIISAAAAAKETPIVHPHWAGDGNVPLSQWREVLAHLKRVVRGEEAAPETPPKAPEPSDVDWVLDLLGEVPQDQLREWIRGTLRLNDGISLSQFFAKAHPKGDAMRSPLMTMIEDGEVVFTMERTLKLKAGAAAS